MQTFGEKLEAARKQKGITIREAAEVTKIRGEFLESFENNEFDINLPEIYARGFVKLYARYLGLDPEQAGVEYNAYRMGGLRFSPRKGGGSDSGSRESLGRLEATTPARPTKPLGQMTLPDSQAEEEEEEDQAPREAPILKSKPSHDHDSYFDDVPERDPLDRTLYLKVGIVVAASIIAIFMLILVISAILGGSRTADELDEIVDRTETEVDRLWPQTFTFSTSNATYAYLIRFDDTGREQSGEISPNRPLVLNTDGPFRFSASTSDRNAGLTVETPTGRRILEPRTLFALDIQGPDEIYRVGSQNRLTPL